MKPATLLLAATIPLLSAAPAMADRIVFPGRVLERDGPVELIYRLDRPERATGTLALEWTDMHGRLVERRAIPVRLDGGTDIPVVLDLTRARAMANWLHTRLTLNGAGTAMETYFVTAPPDDGWTDYQVVMWQNQGPAQYRTLRELGFSAGKIYAVRDDRLFSDLAGPLLENDLRWYVENIATDFYSAYHRWHPEKPNNWRFLEAKRRYSENPGDRSAFVREPSLSDPEWLDTVRARLSDTVTAYRPYTPLFYNLADEPGIAQTGAFWDFDLSQHSLAGMRDWLRAAYGSLDALNAQWGTTYAAWDEVMPETTAAAVMRNDDNFSAWSDFKAWMDVAFARAIRAGTDAVHAADAQARAAIEGTQIPGWGGYDYSLLAQAVDVMEIYDYGEAVEIARSLNPDLVILSTLGGGGPRAEHAAWRDLLRGIRGVIFWDERREVVGEDGAVGPRGLQAAGWIGEMRGGLGALLLGAERHHDPVAMLYSPASQRVGWMLEVKPQGQAWAARDVDAEYADNPIRSAIARFTRALARMGLQHRMVTSRQIADGALVVEGYALLLLPHAIVLAPDEARAIRDFVAQGGTVVAEGAPGQFDGHGRRFDRPPLADLFPDTAAAMRVVPFGKGRAVRLPDAAPADGDMRPLLGPILAGDGILPRFPLARPDGAAADGVETRVLHNGGVTLVALQRNPPRVEADGTAAAAAPLMLSLPRPAHVYDLRRGRALGRHGQVPVALDGVAPTLLALAGAPLPAPRVEAPARAVAGDTVMVDLGWDGPSDAAFQVLRVEVIDPTGRTVRPYSGNLIVAGRRAGYAVPLAFNDPAGIWRVRVTDVMSGGRAEARIAVAPR